MFCDIIIGEVIGFYVYIVMYFGGVCVMFLFVYKIIFCFMLDVCYLLVQFNYYFVWLLID